jgi:K+-sensing histidine kinase KdpD
MVEEVAKASSSGTTSTATGNTLLLVPVDRVEEGNLAASLGGIGLLTFSMLLVPLREFLGAANAAIVLLVGVQVLAVVGGRRGAVTGAIVAALSFDFFFTEPYLQLVIDDRRDIITALLLLVTGIATSELGSLRVRRRIRRLDGEGS